jgi:hypothetical protein
MRMKFKNIIKYLLIFFFLLIPSAIFAADLDITCYSDRSPDIVRNIDPLFQLTGFLPGSTSSRTIYVENTDTVNDCRIYFLTTGDSNILTNKIEVNVSGGLFNGSLTQYIDDTRLLMANLSPNEEVTRTITMELPTDAGNTYASKNASFDITVQSEWGDDTVVEEGDDQGEVAGATDSPEEGGGPVGAFLTNFLGIGGPDSYAEATDRDKDIEGEEEIEKDDTDADTKQGEVLGEEQPGECTEKTLWWIPIVIQLIVTLLIISVDKSILRKKYIKLLLSILLGIIAYLATERIGCGCNLVWLCNNHWIINTLIGSFPVLTYIKRNSDKYPTSEYESPTNY